jgi:hypothetical protein
MKTESRHVNDPEVDNFFKDLDIGTYYMKQNQQTRRLLWFKGWSPCLPVFFDPFESLRRRATRTIINEWKNFS